MNDFKRYQNIEPMIVPTLERNKKGKSGFKVCISQFYDL